MAVDVDPTVDFVGGMVAGVVGLLVAHPFDTVKVRLQNPALCSKYRSAFNAFTTIVREERFTGLYKGVVSPLATCAFMNGLVFASYKFFMRAQFDDPASVPTLKQVAVAGTGCGIVTSIIASPTELVKIRQQNVLVNGPSNASAMKVAMNILRCQGLRGLYRGLPATALRDTGYGTYFLAYEATCRYFKPPSTRRVEADHSSLLSEIDAEAYNTPWPVLFLAGGVAGVAGWLATFPMDVIKTRMQSTEAIVFNPVTGRTIDAHNPFRSIFSTTKHSYRTEGIGFFFRGIGPTLLRSIPVNVATFSVYEYVVHILS